MSGFLLIRSASLDFFVSVGAVAIVVFFVFFLWCACFLAGWSPVGDAPEGDVAAGAWATVMGWSASAVALARTPVIMRATIDFITCFLFGWGLDTSRAGTHK